MADRKTFEKHQKNVYSATNAFKETLEKTGSVDKATAAYNATINSSEASRQVVQNAPEVRAQVEAEKDS